MCGRYALFGKADKMQVHYRVANDFEWEPRYNLAPTDKVPVLQLDSGFKRILSLAAWGFVNSQERGASLIINARAETVLDKPSFKPLTRVSRCVLPASGFYEWAKKDPDKMPRFISPVYEGAFFSMAGLVRSSEEDGHLKQETVILTTQANSSIQPLHDRMPVILSTAEIQDWLNPNLSFPQELALRSFESEKMNIEIASKQVNSVGMEGAELLVQDEPVMPRQPSLF